MRDTITCSPVQDRAYTHWDIAYPNLTFVLFMWPKSVTYPPGGQGERVPPDFKPRGTVMQKLPHTFLTHNNAMTGPTSQSLGLPAYACKTDSSTAIKLAPRMHKNLPL